MNLKTFSIDTQETAFDDENLIISFTALSKNPTIKRKSIFGDDFYISIDTDSVDFKADTFYLDHSVSFGNAIGKITDFKRDEKGDLKVKVQFFKDISRSYDAYKKYKNGLSKSVSVGFGECEIKELAKKDGLKHFKITKGSIDELSAVWQGADPNAVISAFQKFQKEQQMTTQTTSHKTSDEVNEILELGRLAGKSELAIQAVQEGKSFKEFSTSLIQERNFNQAQAPSIPKESATDFNIAKYARAIAQNASVADVNFEQGNHGLIIPDDYFARYADEQVVKSIDTKSAGFVPEYRHTEKFIDSVFASSNILSLCDKLTGLRGTQSIPVDDSDVKAYWVKEGKKTPTSKVGATTISLNPFTLKAKVKITRQMLNMTDFALENFIRQKMQVAMKLKLESSLLYGEASGDDDPIKGIFNADGIQSISNYFNKPTYESTLDFASKILDKNFSTSNAKFIANTKAMVKLQTTHRSTHIADTPYLLNSSGDNLAGYSFIANNLLQDNHIIFGDFHNILVGAWNSLQIQAFRDDEGDTTFTGFYDVGMVVKRPTAFVIAQS